MPNHRKYPLLIGLSLAFSNGSASAPPSDASAALGQTFEYQILREGDPVGVHRVQLRSQAGQTRVLAHSQIEIGLLGWTFYRFDYQAEELWDEHGLRRLSSRVDDNGETLRIKGRRTGERFQWSVNDHDAQSHEMPVFPTNHWNAAVLSQNQVLNTLTGAINQVSVQPHQADAPFDSDTPNLAEYRYSGELELDAWYSEAGRWLGMRFKGRDGSTIEYLCRNCAEARSL